MFAHIEEGLFSFDPRQRGDGGYDWIVDLGDLRVIYLDEFDMLEVPKGAKVFMETLKQVEVSRFYLEHASDLGSFYPRRHSHSEPIQFGLIRMLEHDGLVRGSALLPKDTWTWSSRFLTLDRLELISGLDKPWMPCYAFFEGGKHKRAARRSKHRAPGSCCVFLDRFYHRHHVNHGQYYFPFLAGRLGQDVFCFEHDDKVLKAAEGLLGLGSERSVLINPVAARIFTDASASDIFYHFGGKE